MLVCTGTAGRLKLIESYTMYNTIRNELFGCLLIV